MRALKNGEMGISEAKNAVESLPLLKLAHTRLDLGRRERTGVGEVVFGAGKTPRQINEIVSALRSKGQDVLVTRISDKAAAAVRERFPEAEISQAARTATITSKRRRLCGRVAIVTAGTSDMPVAEEARITAEFLGDKTESFYDCGVAGIHRLSAVIDKIKKARVVIVIAGMEGALASVVAGLVKSPVIAVPTSVGYGANFGGLAALLSMINSCANGVSIVNIDNGFGAAYNAHLINSVK